MRFTRILLVLAFLAVGAVYTVQDMVGRLSTADDPPTLTCGSEILDVSVADGDAALLAGITASDPQDGDITDRVLVTGASRLLAGNTARVSYAVFDSDHNMATLTRQIRYTDYRLPRFVLNEPLVYGVNDSVQLLDRLRATDVIGGDITGNIRISYANISREPGVHSLEAQVTNSMGDTAWITLPVIIVSDLENRVEVELDTYLVYLNQGDSFDARRFLNAAYWQGDRVSNSNVTITGEVDTDTPGTYLVEYTCTYGSRTGTVILTVVVE